MGFEGAFSYKSAREIFSEFAQLTRATPYDYSGLNHDRLKVKGPAQWPCPTPDHAGTSRLYENARFAAVDGRANFISVEHQEPVEVPDSEYPLALTTGRVKNQWHTMTRTGKSPSLVKSTPEPFLEMNPADAKKESIRDADFGEVLSRRGKAMAQVRVTEQITTGTCFIPFHWGRRQRLLQCRQRLPRAIQSRANPSSRPARSRSGRFWIFLRATPRPDDSRWNRANGTLTLPSPRGRGSKVGNCSLSHRGRELE